MLYLNLVRQKKLSIMVMCYQLPRVLPLICLFVLSGCAGTITQNSQYHMINASPDGNAHSIEVKTYYYSLPGIEGAEETDQWSTVGNDYHDHVDKVLNHIEELQKNQQKPMDLMIFVHGGLNTLEASIERVREQYQPILKDNVYPVFINWRSGPFTSYYDHLFRIRDGQLKPVQAKFSSPFYFLTDLFGVFAKIPEAWVEQGRDSVVDTLARDDSSTKSLVFDYPAVKVSYSENDTRPISDSVVKGGVWTLTSIPKILTTSAVYSFGKPTWDIMVRRSRELLIRSCEFKEDEDGCNDPPETAETSSSILKMYNVETLEELETSEAKNLICKTGSRQPVCSGVLSVFMKKLIEKRNNCTESSGDNCNNKITLIGHSMGAIVVAELLKYFPNVMFDNIVFMGAAATSRNALSSLVPYMQMPGHEKTMFYNLSLHPHAEDTERNMAGFVPNGSLLTWIDAMYGLPQNEIDRTFGQWLNARQVARLIPVNIADRFHFRIFGFNDEDPQTHGSFDDFSYWQPEFWGKGQFSE